MYVVKVYIICIFEHTCGDHINIYARAREEKLLNIFRFFPSFYLI